MAEINLSERRASTAELVVNLTNEDTGTKQRLVYDVERISGGQAAQMQIEQAEFARHPDRETITGSLAFQRVVKLIHPRGDAPDFMALLERVPDDGLKPLFEAAIQSATSSTVEG